MMATASPERVEHALQVLSSFESMKSREFICDFKVKVGCQSFNIHRALLGACSGYFEALFSSNMKEAQDGYIIMKDVGVSPIEQCIEYIYTGSCKIEMDSVEGILHASNLLQIQSLEKKCFNYLKHNLQPENCLSILTLARIYNHQDLENAAEDMIVNNLEAVISLDLFLSISKKDLFRYMSHANHETSWRAVKTWSKGRQKEFSELAERIDFSRFSFKILLNEVLNDPLVEKSPKIKSIVQQSLFSNSKKLEMNLDPKNCFLLKKFATGEKSKKIIDSFMCRKLSTIISDPQFCDLTKDEVICFLKSKSVSEKSKWEASLKWVKGDPNNRKSSFPDLFSSLKLTNLPLKFLKETVRNEDLVSKSNLCMNLLMDAIINYPEQSGQRKQTKAVEASTGEQLLSFKRQPPGGLVLVSTSVKKLLFKFKMGSYEGIQYPAYTFEYFIPNLNLMDRLKNAFIGRQLFKLRYEFGSDQGEIVLGDIPLDPDRDPFSLDQLYARDLNSELEKKGF